MSSHEQPHHACHAERADCLLSLIEATHTHTGNKQRAWQVADKFVYMYSKFYINDGIPQKLAVPGAQLSRQPVRSYYSFYLSAFLDYIYTGILIIIGFAHNSCTHFNCF